MESSPAVNPRRALGAYYTPADVASTLATWALQSNVGPVLDPSYGPCRFLTAALDVLRASGARHPADIHGIDIDAVATEATTGSCSVAARDQSSSCTATSSPWTRPRRSPP